jgi:choline dehydrogenase-like flavoprotein
MKKLDYAPYLIDLKRAKQTQYDVVIIGSGIAGSIIAKNLAKEGKHILVVEAGPGEDISLNGYEENVHRFYTATDKDGNSPYAKNPNAEMPRGADTVKMNNGQVNDRGYIVQKGPLELDSSYSKVLGGTTRHWEGKALRMVPDDFNLNSKFGVGRDWPVNYEDLEPHYRKAELEMGVSGNVEDQDYCGLRFPEKYVYPMLRMPPSYLDQTVAKDVDGMQIGVKGDSYELFVRSTPQARNGVPNKNYDHGVGYKPRGGVSYHQAEIGGRCQGNTNCVPICPVQAKYDARRTLKDALNTGRVDLLTRCVGSKVEINRDNGRVVGILCKSYSDINDPNYEEAIIEGEIYVLATNAVENPRLLLASGLSSSSGLVGKNLMDHAYLLTWALMPEPIGAMRGPLCTSGIEDIRTGGFRSSQAAVRFSIHNDGWGWATGAPHSDLEFLIEDQNAFGQDLKKGLIDRVSRQILLDCMIEVLPDESNRISVEPSYTDAIGNMRPVVSFDVPSYSLETVAFSRDLTRRIYQRIGAEDYSKYSPLEPGYVSYEGEDYVIRGGNHWAGTHIMGASRSNSVVDADQRSWDHENLFLAGAGSMPSIGTANTTLTLAALCLRTAETITKELNRVATATKQNTGT